MVIVPVPLGLFGGGIGYGEVILILFVALLVFGRRLPEVGRSLGAGLSEFKKGLKGVADEAESEPEEKPEVAGTSETPPAPPSDSEKKDDLAG